MERLLATNKQITPPASNGNDPLAKRWHELRALVVRGVNEPDTLTADEITRVSSVALVGLKDVGLDWGDVGDPPASTCGPG